jgi:hypothetical protein
VMNDYSIIQVNQAITADPAIQTIVDSLKAGVVAQFGDIYHTVTGTALNELSERYDTTSPLRDTPLGNLITDAFQNKTGTDIAITPLGLISEEIFQGPIVGADVFRSLSYGYDQATGLGLQLATFEITGAELVHGMEVGLSQLEVGDDFFLQYSGVRFKYDPTKPVGERVILNSIRINGKKLNPAKIYSATVNTGVIMLLGQIGVNVSNIQLLPDFEYNVVKDYISSLQQVNVHSHGRVMEFRAGERLSSDAEESVSAARIKLADNFPNPFSGNTKFEFSTLQKCAVDLKVFDTLGKEVAAIACGDFDEGTYRFLWDASALAEGVYYYQLKAGDFSETKKLLLTK